VTFLKLYEFEGTRTGRSKQVDIQQNGDAACADKFERARIWRCRGQGVRLRRQSSDAELSKRLKKGLEPAEASQRIFSKKRPVSNKKQRQ